MRTFTCDVCGHAFDPVGFSVKDRAIGLQGVAAQFDFRDTEIGFVVSSRKDLCFLCVAGALAKLDLREVKGGEALGDADVS